MSTPRPTRMSRMWGPADPGRLALWCFAGAAVAVGVAGYLHGQLFHQGYGHVAVVGPLFALNVVGSAAVILLLLARRVALFAAGALSISTGAVASIVVSHGPGFFGFSESGYSTAAGAIVVCEVAAVVLATAGLGVARGRVLAGPPAPA